MTTVLLTKNGKAVHEFEVPDATLGTASILEHLGNYYVFYQLISGAAVFANVDKPVSIRFLLDPTRKNNNDS